MKNTGFKTKLVARMMVLVLLLTSVLSFTGCTRTATVDRTLNYKTHAKLVEFIGKYNSKNDGFVNTFISFDFDNHDKVTPYEYNLDTLCKLKIPFRGESYVEWYDKEHPYGFWCEYCFHVESPSVQIICSWGTKDYNFYQNDEMSIEFVDKFNTDYDEDKEIELMFNYNYASFYSFIEDMGDRRSQRIKTEYGYRYEKQYSYVYFYQLKINGEDMMFIKIYTETEFEDEQLNEIFQLLRDNIVIINAEG